MSATREFASLILSAALTGSGGVAYGISRARAEGHVTNIYFHQPTAAAFRSCIVSLLKRGYNPISSLQLDEAIHGGRPLPALPLHISFDDAWRANVVEVAPVVEELDIPVTIFVPTEPIETGRFWWTEVEDHVRDGGRTVGRLKRVPDHQRREYLAEIRRRGGRGPRDAMTLKELRWIADLRQVTIGSHTVTHPILPNCTDAVIDEEIRLSREILEDWLHHPVTTFAFPNGDYDERALAALRRHGYRLAFSTRQAHASVRTDPALALPRFALRNDAPAIENVSRASGAWSTLFHRDHKNPLGAVGQPVSQL